MRLTSFSVCGKVVLATQEGVFILTASGFGTPTRPGASHALLEYHDRLFLAAEDGLFEITLKDAGEATFTKHGEGSFTSLATAGRTACVFGKNRQLLLDAHGKIVRTMSYEVGGRCNRGRELAGKHHYCTESGVLTAEQTSPGNWSSSFAPSPSDVYDVVSYQDTLLVATADGIKRMAPKSWLTGVRAVIISSGFLLAAYGVFFAVTRPPRVFLSYRRLDSQVFVGRIQENLFRLFGRRRVIFDKLVFRKGADFRTEMRQLISQCDVFVPCIGGTWMSTLDSHGGSRLDNPDDPVRIEVEMALELGKPVLPILLLDTDMPKDAELPPTLGPLVFLNACRIRDDPDFADDFQEFVKAVKQVVKGKANASTQEKPTAK